MSPPAVIGLLTSLAEAFGLVASDVVAWARQKHPELTEAPPPDGEAKVDSEIDEDK